MLIQFRFILLNFLLLFVCFAVFVFAAYGQERKNETTNDKNDTIRVNTNLIQTEVTVVDKNGRFVDGLKPEQFELRVDGKPTPIDFFDKVISERTLKMLSSADKNGGDSSNGNGNVGVAQKSAINSNAVSFLRERRSFSFSTIYICRSTVWDARVPPFRILSKPI